MIRLLFSSAFVLGLAVANLAAIPSEAEAATPCPSQITTFDRGSYVEYFYIEYPYWTETGKQARVVNIVSLAEEQDNELANADLEAYQRVLETYFADTSLSEEQLAIQQKLVEAYTSPVKIQANKAPVIAEMD